MMDALLRFCLRRKLVVFLTLAAVVAWGTMVAPFDPGDGILPRAPIAVDAIPDIGENQQIVFTEWMGRSPQDVEDQITYPLTVALLSVPGVKTVRSYSFFGFSTVYVIFEEGVEFYWSRSRVLEKLATLTGGALPEGVQPALGPDATALGQVFWYTLEGRDPDGNATGGWGLEELRRVQDWQVRYALLSAEGVSEVGSVGGHREEYQIDVDPDAMRAYGVTLDQVFNAARRSNLDVGARTIEVNGAEYVIRGLGFIQSIDDIESIAITARDGVPIRMREVARVTMGPALRRGVLDRNGAEAVGGVVVVRFGANPLATIAATRQRIAEIAPGLPSKAVVDFRRTTPPALASFAAERGFAAFEDGRLNQQGWVRWLRANERSSWPLGVTLSQVTIVPFYDRTGLIRETLGTLNDALSHEIFLTVIVVLIMVMHLRSAALISALLPVAVLITFVAMKLADVPANIVALAGIAIAIGTMVDMAVIICENILRHLDEAGPAARLRDVVFRATREVSGAIIASVATTVVSFLPVFTLTGAEGKLFTPLAFTKTFALLAALAVAITVIPPAAELLFGARVRSRRIRLTWFVALLLVGVGIAWHASMFAGLLLVAFAGLSIAHVLDRLPEWLVERFGALTIGVAASLIAVWLAMSWLPLGPERWLLANLLFVVIVVGSLLWAFRTFQRCYPALLAWCLERKAAFLVLPILIVGLGVIAWLGFDRTFSFAPQLLRDSAAWQRLDNALPGLGREFMPTLDEGSFLYMPTTMPHASLGEAQAALQLLDRAIAAIPEVEESVGKLGRADTPLDPAPISMFEIMVSYLPEYRTDRDGRLLRFAYDAGQGRFERDAQGQLIIDGDGRPYRQWRDHIRTTDDIWREITAAASLPGVTSAPRLQPIAARLVMLQSGMRAPMGVKVQGPDLAVIEQFGLALETHLKAVPGVAANAVAADRLVGKPYLEIDLDREALARYGLHIADVQQVIEVAIGGRPVTSTVEGRERYPVRIRYPRELRDAPERLGEIVVPTANGAQIPLEQLSTVRYVRGPQAIKSEDTFLVGYVVFDKEPNAAEVDVVERAQAHLKQLISTGELIVPDGVSYTFTGNYENQLRAQRTLSVVVPLSLGIIFVILYLQFSAVSTALIVFSGVALAWAGGFLLLWLYGIGGFLDINLFGSNVRELLQIGPTNLSVAVWVGFLALFGIATDNGVVTATYLDQTLHQHRPDTTEALRQRIIEGATRRIRPALMTTATTLLALVPVLMSTGRGSDILAPMAIPVFGGMLVAVLGTLLVPVLYCWVRERNIAPPRTA